jgi:hypothetical protein
MLHQICRRGRLLAFLQNGKTSSDGYLNKAFNILGRRSEAIGSSETQMFTPFDEAQKNGAGEKLPLDIYDLIFEFITDLSSSNTMIRHFKDLPHPLESRIFSPFAIPIRHIKYKTRTFSTFKTHPGSSSISFSASDGTTRAGFIDSMWQQVMDGNLQTFIIVSPHDFLSDDDEKKNPYTSRPGFLCNIFYTQVPSDPLTHSRRIVIREDQIIGHVAYYKRPPGTFGIKKAISIFVDSLHRNR